MEQLVHPDLLSSPATEVLVPCVVCGRPVDSVALICELCLNQRYREEKAKQRSSDADPT